VIPCKGFGGQLSIFGKDIWFYREYSHVFDFEREMRMLRFSLGHRDAAALMEALAHLTTNFLLSNIPAPFALILPIPS
jgi:hypothetical protein